MSESSKTILVSGVLTTVCGPTLFALLARVAPAFGDELIAMFFVSAIVGHILVVYSLARA